MSNLPPWAIVVTKPAAEEIAERSLRQAGYRTYLPRYRKATAPHGFAYRAAPAMRPLFEGIVLAHNWHGWPKQPISGIVGLMRSAGKPAQLPDADAELIWMREKSGDFDELPPPRALIPGDAVAFHANGAEILGILHELSPGGKAVVETLLFNRQTTLRNVEQKRLRLVRA